MTTLLNLMLARADIPEQARVPCHFYIDEFHNYSSDTLTETFAEGRKYKVYLTVATQIIGQGMTTAMQKQILGNVNVKLIGKAGHESRELMVKQMGFNNNEERRSLKAYYASLRRMIFTRKPVTARAFRKLQTGRFIGQVDIYNPHRITNWKKLLGNRNSMSEAQRQQVQREQIERYYVSPSLYTPPPAKIESSNPFDRTKQSFWKARRGETEQMDKRHKDGF